MASPFPNTMHPLRADYGLAQKYVAHLGHRLNQLAQEYGVTKKAFGPLNKTIHEYRMSFQSMIAVLHFEERCAYLDMSEEARCVRAYDTLQAFENRNSLTPEEKQQRAVARRKLSRRFREITGCALDDYLTIDDVLIGLHEALAFQDATKQKRILEQHKRTLEADYKHILNKIEQYKPQSAQKVSRSVA